MTIASRCCWMREPTSRYVTRRGRRRSIMRGRETTPRPWRCWRRRRRSWQRVRGSLNARAALSRVRRVEELDAIVVVFGANEVGGGDVLGVGAEGESFAGEPRLIAGRVFAASAGE